MVLILLLALSIFRGVRLGAAVQVLSFGGFWVGLLAGALLAPPLARLVSSPTSKAVVSLVVVFGAALIVGAVGRQLGVGAWRLIRQAHLGPADSGVGAVVAAAATLFAVWILAAMLQTSSFPALARQINGSTIIRRMDNALPAPPDMFSRIQQLLDTHGFPQVFAGLAPADAGPVQEASTPQEQAAINAAGESTVKIVSQGCGEILEGSGFIVAPGLVVTNAHVIAGTTSIQVQQDGPDSSGLATPATPIYFDPDFDLAVLRTGDLSGPPLRIDSSYVPRGTDATVLGYPGGGPFTPQPAGVRQLFDATGRNIYGAGLTEREVYELQAIVRPGNSGGPLVAPDGTVIGVVFSTSATDPDIGYALASPGVASRVAAAERSNTPTGTGSCAE